MPKRADVNVPFVSMYLKDCMKKALDEGEVSIGWLRDHFSSRDLMGV